MSLTAEPFPLLSDNYAWLLRDSATGAIAVADPGEAPPLIAALAARGERPDLLLITHHHGDHIGGIEEMRRRFPEAKVVGARADAYRLPPLDQAVEDGGAVRLGASTGRVIGAPGHTRGHVAYFFADGPLLLCGDTLFSLGCGRLLEGVAAEMFASLRKFAALPSDTLICCGHEYTQANARFALHVDPHNQALQARAAEANRLREQGLPTVPTRLADEMAANPFLRAKTAERLGALRARKDGFP